MREQYQPTLPTAALAAAYATAVAEHEAELHDRPSLPEAMGRASREVALTATMIAENAHARQLRRQLSRTNQTIRIALEDETSELSSAAFAMRAGFRLLQGRNLRRTADDLQADTWRWAVRDSVAADYGLQQPVIESGQSDDLRGKRSERLTASLLNRPGQRTLAMPALPHHEASVRHPHNYDILMLHAPADTGTIDDRKIQVKTMHTGPRDTHDSPFTIQDRYNDDIVIVSGCCELTQGNPARYQRVTGLLLRELLDIANDDHLAELDELSADLSRTIIDGTTTYKQHRDHLAAVIAAETAALAPGVPTPAMIMPLRRSFPAS